MALGLFRFGGARCKLDLDNRGRIGNGSDLVHYQRGTPPPTFLFLHTDARLKGL